MPPSPIAIFFRENWHLIVALGVTVLISVLALGRFFADDYSGKQGGTVTLPTALAADR